MNRVSYTSLMILMACSTFGCRTTNSENNDTKSKPAINVVTGKVSLGDNPSENLYLQLLKIETSSGTKVPQEQLHSSQGLLQCFKDGILKTCYLRARLIDGALSEKHATDGSIVDAFWQHAANTRASVVGEQMIVANVDCHYVGPKSPPYKAEKVTCEIMHIRFSNEVVIATNLAAALAESIRGNQVTDNINKLVLHGTLLCREDKTNGPICLTRGYEEKELSQNIRELGTAETNQLNRRLRQTYRDHASLTSEGKIKTYTDPNEVLSQVRCHVDLTQPQIFGGYLCRIQL